jgi:ribonuclease PH
MTEHMSRPDGRAPDALRPITFIPHIVPNAAGSVLCCFGDTRVICTVTIEEGVPRWMKEQNVQGGWLTAEYAMLPASTAERKARDISKGKLDGRSSEIQRLIGRSLRAVVDLSLVGQRTIYIDCDVLQADGGTRTASITGACVAAALAFDKLVAAKKIFRTPLTKMVAAVSAGIFKNEALLDLNYVEDKDAEVDANFVMTEDGAFVEIQSAGEESTFTAAQFTALQALGAKGITELCALQKAAVNATREKADEGGLKGLADFFAKR